jgi:hypothetical protein
METLEQQIFLSFRDELPCSAQASPVSRHPSPGSAEARAMTVGSGRQLSMLFDCSSPLGVFSKILLESPHFTNSEEFCYVWQVWDTRLDCSAFQLTPLEQNTDGSGSLLWPTATAAKLWPTPTVPNGGRRNPEGTSITGKKPSGGKAQIDMREFAIRQTGEDSGSLNPLFVEELMGFQIDHTALKPSETPSSRNRRSRSSKR